jgi:tetratricopeptide (TPR) repeat protein
MFAQTTRLTAVGINCIRKISSTRLVICGPLAALAVIPALASAAICTDLATLNVSGASHLAWGGKTQPYYALVIGENLHLREKSDHREILKLDGLNRVAIHPELPKFVAGRHVPRQTSIDRQPFRLWDIQPGQATSPKHEDADRVAFLGSRYFMLWCCGGVSARARIIDSESGRELLGVPGTSVASWSETGPGKPPRSTLIAHFGDDYRDIVVRELETGRELSRIAYERSFENKPPATFISRSRLAVGYAKDRVAKVHDTATGMEVVTYPGFSSVESSGGFLVLSGGERGVLIVDSAGKDVFSQSGVVAQAAEARADTRGRLRAVITKPLSEWSQKNGTIALWDPLTGQERGRWEANWGTLSPDGALAISYARHGTLIGVKAVDSATGREVCADVFEEAKESADLFERLPVLNWLSSTTFSLANVRDGGAYKTMIVDLGRSNALGARKTASNGAAAHPLFSRAFDSFQRGDYAAAAADFEAGLHMDPSNAAARFYLGETYLRLKNNNAAAREYLRVRELSSNSRESMQAVERLTQLGLEQPGTLTDGVSLRAMDNQQLLRLVEQALRKAAPEDSRYVPYKFKNDKWLWGSEANDFWLKDLMLAATPTDKDVLVDLDTGDGTIPLYAALRFGLRAIGIQYDPEVARRSNEAARALGVADRVRFVAGDALDADLQDATVVTLSRNLRTNDDIPQRFAKKLRKLPRSVRIASTRANRDLWKWVPDRTVGYAHLWFGTGAP